MKLTIMNSVQSLIEHNDKKQHNLEFGQNLADIEQNMVDLQSLYQIQRILGLLSDDTIEKLASKTLPLQFVHLNYIVDLQASDRWVTNISDRLIINENIQSILDEKITVLVKETLQENILN